MTQPNIVLILADDMGFSDLGCYGSEINTPNIDGMAREGVRFSQMYNMARCCPTRASLLTGLYPH
jgi:arylsulfatase A-like enzyme